MQVFVKVFKVNSFLNILLILESHGLIPSISTLFPCKNYLKNCLEFIWSNYKILISEIIAREASTKLRMRRDPNVNSRDLESQ